MKIVVDTQHAKTEGSVNQEVTRQSPTVNQRPATHHGAHEFRWVERSREEPHCAPAEVGSYMGGVPMHLQKNLASGIMRCIGPTCQTVP